ncbi:MAG: DUF2085 domain-containing protein [Acidobacteriota bacterium]|jgi:uncharacterized membrane protein|nr:DUF2085 domain-containing protein [Acidobacteriota bacterium]
MKISARAILAGIWGAIVIAAFSAPLLLSGSFPTAAFFNYLPFSFFCHQMPERSFALLHNPLAVCHRCLGIYLGLFLGTLTAPFFFRIPPRAQRAGIISAAALITLDALLPFTGFWNGFWLCRFLTGLVFGVTAAPFAVMGLDEIFKTLSRRERAFVQGGVLS